MAWPDDCEDTNSFQTLNTEAPLYLSQPHFSVHTEGAAHPADGAGCVAILIGPNAPVVFLNVRSLFSV